MKIQPKDNGKIYVEYQAEEGEGWGCAMWVAISLLVWLAGILLYGVAQ